MNANGVVVVVVVFLSVQMMSANHFFYITLFGLLFLFLSLGIHKLGTTSANSLFNDKD